MSDVAYWIAFNRVPGVGAVRLRSLLNHFDGDLAAAWHATPGAWRAAGLDRRTIRSLLQQRPTLDLAAELERVHACGARVVTWLDEQYPRALREIPSSPPLLYVRGSLEPHDEWALAVVGTRRPTRYGRRAAAHLAGGLAEQGLTVVSGLAMGVDRVAHEAALAVGGRTIAVLACGVDCPYPRVNRALGEQIARGGQGALVSDYPIGTRPEPGFFPPRNRIISGLSLATLVIEAGHRSGALITAQNALEQGREVLALPGSIFSSASDGCHRLIADGAAPARSVEQIMGELNLQLATPERVARRVEPVSALESELLALLGREPLHVDELGRRSRRSAAELSSALALLELKGLVRSERALHYRRA